jgi:DinB family protein
MSEDALSRLRAAHQRVAALIGTIPEAALDWQPDADAWSPKRIVAHIAHAYDFYLLIVEQARAADFGTARLDPGQPGWRRVEATDAAVLACRDVPAVLDQLAATHDRALAIFAVIIPDELDRPFMLASWRPDAAPQTTTLRHRVLEMAADHLDEHHAHLAETLARWRQANTTPAKDG